jgi:hypothetical protein
MPHAQFSDFWAAISSRMMQDHGRLTTRFGHFRCPCLKQFLDWEKETLIFESAGIVLCANPVGSKSCSLKILWVFVEALQCLHNYGVSIYFLFWTPHAHHFNKSNQHISTLTRQNTSTQSSIRELDNFPINTSTSLVCWPALSVRTEACSCVDVFMHCRLDMFNALLLYRCRRVGIEIVILLLSVWIIWSFAKFVCVSTCLRMRTYALIHCTCTGWCKVHGIFSNGTDLGWRRVLAKGCWGRYKGCARLSVSMIAQCSHFFADSMNFFVAVVLPPQLSNFLSFYDLK